MPPSGAGLIHVLRLRSAWACVDELHGKTQKMSEMSTKAASGIAGLLRYFEARGHVLRAMSVIKKRTGNHESTIREYRIGDDGLSVGEPLEAFQGVLRGVPQYPGKQTPLINGKSP
jgi:hypothetical protein